MSVAPGDAREQQPDTAQPTLIIELLLTLVARRRRTVAGVVILPLQNLFRCRGNNLLSAVDAHRLYVVFALPLDDAVPETKLSLDR